jgi:hypothetical protein
MVACAFFRRNTKEWRFHKFTVPASMISGSRECEVELKTKPSLIIADISIRPIIPIVPERGTQYYGSETGNLTQPLPTEAGGFTGLMTPNVVNPIFEYVQPCDGQIAEPTLHKPNATRVLETNTIVSIKQFGEGWGIRVGLPIDFASAYWQAPPTVTKPGILRLEPRAQMSLAGLLLLKAPIFTFVVQAKDSLGRNLSNVKVILTSEDRTQLQGTTDSDGVSTFKLICGKYQLQTFYRGTLVNQSSIDIRDENLLVSKIIICSVYDLTLQVLDHRGKPAKNVSVVLSGTVNERGKTNSNGFVTFSQLPQGNYTISAKDWFLEAEMSIELNSNLTIELILQYSNMLYVLIGASAILALCVIVILLKRKAKSFRKKKRHEKIYLAVNM